MEGLKTWGPWAFIVIAGAVWLQPIADRFVESHFQLIKALESDQRSTQGILDSLQKSADADHELLQEIKQLVEQSGEVYRQTMDSQRQILRSLQGHPALPIETAQP